MNTVKSRKSSGNVYKDLGFPDAHELILKAEIVRLLHNSIKREKLTQTAASEILKISQPDLSKIFSGQFRGFSVERLIRLLTAFRDIEIHVKEKKGRKKWGSLRFIEDKDGQHLSA